MPGTRAASSVNQLPFMLEEIDCPATVTSDLYEVS